MKNYFLRNISFGDVLNVDPSNIPEEMNQVHEAVWELEHHGGSGTAFFIGPNQVVTNFHLMLLSKDGSYKSHSIKDIYLKQGDKRLNLSKVLYASSVEDLIILETEERVSKYLNVSKKEPSGRLFALGYPRGVKKTLIHVEEYGMFDDGYDYVMAVDKLGLEGISGCPVLDGKKEVIGVAYRAVSNMLKVIKVSKLEELRRGFIGSDCSNLLLSSCIEQEIKNLKEKAEQRDFLAQCVLAYMYNLGVVVKEDKEKAFKWTLESAEQGYASAQGNVAQMYEFGAGVKEDKEKAFKWVLESARKGYAPAQAKVAKMYEFGEGVKEDKAKAFKWILESARQGYAIAQHKVAVMYLDGIGVKKNKKQSFDWMLKSARQGYDLAQHTVAVMYLDGIGVKQNIKQAFDWMLKSAMQGDDLAQYKVAVMYLNGIGVKKNKKQSFDWMLKSARQGYAPAQAKVAKMYEFGEGVKEDKEKAFDWMLKSAKQGYAEAQKEVDQMYYNGVGVGLE